MKDPLPNGRIQHLDTRYLHVTESGEECWCPSIDRLPRVAVALCMMPEGEKELWVWTYVQSAAWRALKRLNPIYGWRVSCTNHNGEQNLFVRSVRANERV